MGTNKKETILVTGGAGYIGSHTCVELLRAGYAVRLVDNLANSKEEAVRRVGELGGGAPIFIKADVGDEAALEAAFAGGPVDAVIHFAGFKAVGESVEKPLDYYRNNLGATISLLSCMRRHGVKRLVFSSSATVYGVPENKPLAEEAPRGCTNPYGWTKYMGEQILRDFAAADQGFSAVLLRYFNPIGAHASGRLGEDPRGIPNNLVPYIAQVATGRRESLSVFGGDYPTPDGTCVRDYVHVTDLAKGHLAALDYSRAHAGAEAVNLGTGRGYSVLEVLRAYEKASGVKIPYKMAPRRPGDIAVSFADAAKALKLLGWRAEKDLDEMCRSSHNWQKQNPEGY
ncbi:MAG TPA: UDP-glucose 4-epimerase GalE [Elusimicrobia bacterium]|nr:MAG: UDP-glucose 4-epimerase GalE [Elusimicrobia bacterium GWF2_62_30]HBA59364.1 UDP-glucose 4-epimerase GalE [Elusimicrobiota bacterium]